MDKLPYAVKEKINLFALNTVEDYGMLKEFNKIMDYEPCEYSNRKLWYAHIRNRRLQGRYETEKNVLANNLMYDYLNCLMYEFIEYFSYLIHYKKIYYHMSMNIGNCYIQKQEEKVELLDPFCYHCYLYSCDILKIWYYDNDIVKKYRKKNSHYKIVHPDDFRKRQKSIQSDDRTTADILSAGFK